jgi:hypothetical protein
MEIKRTTEFFVESKRRIVIRQGESLEQFLCPRCGEPTLAAEQIAVVFGISRRRVYQLIETDAAHFAEIETGVVMICLASLTAIIESDSKQLPEEMIDNF